MTQPTQPTPPAATGADAPRSMPPTTRMGPVRLVVADLERSVDFYRRAIGLANLDRVPAGDGAGASATMGAGGRAIVVLEEEPGAKPSRGYSGLYHVAIRVPERVDLARWLAHAARTRVPLTGASDHRVSEAIYLHDPDGHGIEVYRDRPREQWEGRVQEAMALLPLEADDLLGELGDAGRAAFDGLPPGTDVGHVHLRVADVSAAVGFYRDVLGFELTQRYGAGAAFLAAGGYHHHVGLNVWESRGGAPPPRGATGLYHFAILYPTRAALADALRRLVEADVPLDGAADHGVSEAIYLRDPDGNGVELYWDRPAADWPRDAEGRLAMVTEPLDLEDLLTLAPR